MKPRSASDEELETLATLVSLAEDGSSTCSPSFSAASAPGGSPAAEKRQRQTWLRKEKEPSVATSPSTVPSKASKQADGSKPEPRGYWPVFKSMWLMFLNLYVTLGLTLFVFPLIGPFSWKVGATVDMSNANILMGMFQIFDFVGRYIPNIGKIARVPRRFLPIPVVLRLVFVPLFMLCYKLEYTSVFNDLWFQILLMIVFALSNGWVTTNVIIECPGCVDDDDEKSKVGLMLSICMITAVSSGLWASKLLKL
eukprot:GHVT01062238.1.p1 GENE.GHVT01062238.1~~GHVT01062238.1.p1  ORF type:complete len:253 (-),score=44.40 GHVT01062238.1:1555-2313(-)